MSDRLHLRWCARPPSPLVRQYLPVRELRPALAQEADRAREQVRAAIRRRGRPRQEVIPQPTQPPVLQMRRHNRVLPRPFEERYLEPSMAKRHVRRPIPGQEVQDQNSRPPPATEIADGRTAPTGLAQAAPVRAAEPRSARWA